MDVDTLWREWLDRQESGFVLAVEAEKFAAHLRETAPTVLAGWLDEHAPQVLCDRGRGYLSSQRAVANRRMGARHFAEVVANGDTTEVATVVATVFAVTFVVDADDSRLRLADMTGADHKFVADSYEHTGREALMLASFHRAVAKKVGNKRTADVFSPEKYETLFDSIAKRQTTAA